MNVIDEIEREQFKQAVPDLRSGDTVRVHAKVVEGTRERIQVFEGTVIRVTGGGLRKNFTVRRVTHTVGVERTFLIHSPRIDKVEVVRHGDVRQARLYYLRDKIGKEGRIRERRAKVGVTAAAGQAGAQEARQEGSQDGQEGSQDGSEEASRQGSRKAGKTSQKTS